jgi:hypothetical protein
MLVKQEDMKEKTGRWKNSLPVAGNERQGKRWE